MFVLSIAALAAEPPAEVGTELVRVVGLSKDARFVVLEVHEDVHADRGSMGTTERLVAIDTESGERRQWIRSYKSDPKDSPEADPDLKKTWDAQLALPREKAYDMWAAGTAIQPASASETCGSAKRYAALIDVDSEEASPQSSWKGGSFEAEGSGYLVYGVERGGHSWEHAAQHRTQGPWGGGEDLDAAWSADCSHIVWVLRNTMPEMSREGYSASYKRGSIVSVLVAPAGPQVAVAGPSERAGELVSSLAQAGFGATPSPTSPAGLEPAAQLTIYAWSKAEGVAKEMAAALAGAAVAPLPIHTIYDVVVVPAK